MITKYTSNCYRTKQFLTRFYSVLASCYHKYTGSTGFCAIISLAKAYTGQHEPTNAEPMRGSDKESSASLAQVTHYDKVRRSADSFEIPFAYNVSVKRLRGSVALKRIIDRFVFCLIQAGHLKA